MKIMFVGATLILGLGIQAGCSGERTSTESADVIADGSCNDSCGTISSEGACWCDEACATFGDCCLDAADTCGVDECLIDEDCGREMQCVGGDSSCDGPDCLPPAPNDCVASPPSPPGSCSDDEDCYLWSSTCGGCDCLALEVGRPPPLCSAHEQDQDCFMVPCFSMKAVCNDQRCAVESVTPPDTCGTCTSDEYCVAAGLGTQCTTTTGDCLKHCSCAAEACSTVCTGRCI